MFFVEYIEFGCVWKYESVLEGRVFFFLVFLRWWERGIKEEENYLGGERIVFWDISMCY